MDKDIREFEMSMIQLINSNQLPIEIKRLVMKEIYSQVEAKAQEIIMQQIQAEKESEVKEDGIQ